MIVRNLDLESTEDSIRAAFQYITKKPILDIRLAKDKFVSTFPLIKYLRGYRAQILSISYPWIMDHDQWNELL